MANDLNKVFLIGRLTKDPEFKSVKGTSVANFSIANNRSYLVNNEKKEETHYFDCEIWGKLAEVLRDYGKKGKQLAIEGKLSQSTWDTPDGKKASKIRVRVETFQLLGGGSLSPTGNNTYETPAPTYEDISPGDYNEEPIF
ncbi:MAG: single-stranded DNA-binding protein [Spirochaetia bacterium]|nr:single-stranded DNA-binding protein [Spirochaetia bacterium]